MNFKQIYRGEACKGAIVTTVSVYGKMVQVNHIDGDISSQISQYLWVKTDEGYAILEGKDLTTPLDETFGKNSKEIRKIPIKATTDREAKSALIDLIVKPYINPGPHSMPFDVDEVRKGLEAHTF